MKQSTNVIRIANSIRKNGEIMQTDELIRKLRNMAEIGIVNWRDAKTLSEAADRLEELDERVAIMSADTAEDYKEHSGLISED